MNEMGIDVENSGSAFVLLDDVRIPDFFEEGFGWGHRGLMMNGLMIKGGDGWRL